MLNGDSATQGVPGSICSVRGAFEQNLHYVPGTPWMPQGWTASAITKVLITSNRKVGAQLLGWAVFYLTKQIISKTHQEMAHYL